MLAEEARQLLEPGYMSIETGHFRLPNGQLQVRVLTRMPGCKAKMIDWWFGYLDGIEKYRMWEPKSHLSLAWDEHWSPGRYVGASCLVKDKIGGAVQQMRILFHDPTDFFEPGELDGAYVGAVICASAFDP